MSWQEEIRANRQAKAEAARLDEAARTGNDIARMKAAGELARADREQDAKLVAEAKATADAIRDKRRGERKAKRAKATAFAKAHVVDGLIYGIALVSFVMAAPAMSGYGEDVYRSPLGALLPLITELGMWAFAIAVLISRIKAPDRPVWGYQAGVWVFGTLAFLTNAVHGWSRGFDAALIMGVVSVAGVVAHQLAIATPPRSKAQRAADKLAAARAAKTHAAARAALKAAAAQIDAEGNARLTYVPGTFDVRRRRLVPVEPDLDVVGPPDALDAELAKLLGSGHPDPEPGPGGGIATDPGPSPGPARDDTAEATPDRPAPHRTARTTKRGGRSGPVAKTGRDTRFEALRARFDKAVESGHIDPGTASIYRIAKTLRCGKPAAKRLLAERQHTDQD
ncbi:cell envelope integrity protein TolA [Amycolatopsis sp. WAC 01376]|uniref:cell envelope integrity protein TolA n=1 Tax=Amycolatopsis sp. WAC 01376 TaxID=2203195 RepID=UPI0013158E29|nr:cell envelope integrity protein TolA [Amycolatopsis sp. WAC 01376]